MSLWQKTSSGKLIIGGSSPYDLSDIPCLIARFSGFEPPACYAYVSGGSSHVTWDAMGSLLDGDYPLCPTGAGTWTFNVTVLYTGNLYNPSPCIPANLLGGLSGSFNANFTVTGSLASFTVVGASVNGGTTVFNETAAANTPMTNSLGAGTIEIVG